MSYTKKYHLFKNVYSLLISVGFFSTMIGACMADAESMVPMLTVCSFGICCMLIANLAKMISTHYRREARKEKIMKRIREERKRIMFGGEYTKLTA